MRDLARIPLIWTAFERAHALYPDWRFGQFLVNFLGWYGRDPFFAEDDEWLKIIDQYIAKRGCEKYDPKWQPKAVKSQKSGSNAEKKKASVTTEKKKTPPKTSSKRKKKEV